MNRAERRRHRRAGGTVLAVVCGWAEDTPDDRNRVRREAAERLEAQLGRRRQGPTSWTDDAGEDALARLARLEHDCRDPELLDHYAETRWLLEECGGRLVCAQAPAR